MANCLTLIGMPGAGKSTVGRALAESLKLSFLDTDDEIQATTGLTLEKLIATHGDDGFCQLENLIVSRLDCVNTIIATGGSVVFGADAMARLQKLGRIAYLESNVSDLHARLGNLETRGVVGGRGKTLAQIFEERVPFYNRYADVHVSGRVEEAVAFLTDWHNNSE